MIAASEPKAVDIDDEKITVGDKVVLHLGQYVNTEFSKFGMPYAMTQDGIGVACGISRAHASVELKKLLEKGTVGTEKVHVSGCKTMRNIYFLTQSGMYAYCMLSDRIGVDPTNILFPQNKEKKGIRNPILDRCFRKVLRCALELQVQRDRQKPVLTDVETDLLDVVKTLCRN